MLSIIFEYLIQHINPYKLYFEGEKKSKYTEKKKVQIRIYFDNLLPFLSVSHTPTHH